MSLYSVLTRLADAIRSKAGVTGKKTLTELAELAEGIESGIDTSDATATDADMPQGVTAYARGKKITGNVPYHNAYGGYDIYNGYPEMIEGKGLQIRASVPSDILLRTNAMVRAYAEASRFGNAMPADVVAGKIFTSAAGVGMVGTASGGGSGNSGAVNMDAPIIFEVEKKTSNTYASETTYNNESFILLDVYPKSGGTVNITYGGLTKTVVDDGTSAEPNAQEVFFGTFNGVTDDVATPSSGILTVTGDCRGIGITSFKSASKTTSYCGCITKIYKLTGVEIIPAGAFENCEKLTSVEIPSSVETINALAFSGCTNLKNVFIQEGLKSIAGLLFSTNIIVTSITIPSTVMDLGAVPFLGCKGLRSVVVLATTPPTLGDGLFDTDGIARYGYIIVPPGCGEVYKAAEVWSLYADWIIEAPEVVEESA